jgi:hypothetical protein
MKINIRVPINVVCTNNMATPLVTKLNSASIIAIVIFVTKFTLIHKFTIYCQDTTVTKVKYTSVISIVTVLTNVTFICLPLTARLPWLPW